MRNYNAEIGEQLRIERLIRRRTLQNVADALGLTKNTISYYEKGKTPITIDRLIEYCEYLGIDYIELLKKVSN